MTAAKSLRRQARATGSAKIGRCIIGEMSRPWTTSEKANPLLAVRIREIETIIRARHGFYVPDARGTDDLESCCAYVLAVAGSGGEFRGWSRRWLPWLTDQAVFDKADALATKLAKARRPAILPADAIAKLLAVRLGERQRLGLRTIGSCDVSLQQRKADARAAKRIRDRARQQARRKAAGATPRDEWTAASVASQKPWEAEGISRRTWYRRQAGTGPSRIEINIIVGDTPVPTLTEPVTISAQETPSCEAAMVTGFGAKAPTEFQEAEPHGASYELKTTRRHAHG